MPNDAAGAPSTPPKTAKDGSTPPGAAEQQRSVTLPQLLAFVAFTIFVLCAVFTEKISGGATQVQRQAGISGSELDQLKLLTLYLIGFLLPSDALIRIGRNLLFSSVDDAVETKAAAEQAPSATLAQWLAFGTFVIAVIAAYISNALEITTREFEQILDTAQVLIAALLPSDAGLRFGRAVYHRASPPAGGVRTVAGKI